VEVPSGHTFYQVFTGKGTLFECGRKLTLGEIDKKDGTANTILVIEAGEAVPWSNPADLVHDAGLPVPPLGGAFPGRTRWAQGPGRVAGFNFCFADCSTRFIRRSRYNEELLRPLITWNDGQMPDLSDMLD